MPDNDFGEGSHSMCADQNPHAPNPNQFDSADQDNDGIHTLADSRVNLNGEAGQESIKNHSHDANLSTLCDTLRELHRQRQDLHRAEKSLTLQIKAKCRRLCGGDKAEADKVYKSLLNGCDHHLAVFALTTTTPFINARALLEKERKATEKQMEKAAKKLPGIEFVKSVSGFGLGSFAAIIGEAGNLSDYSTVAKFWKRMGLAVIKGERQRRVSGADALEHGYSPVRRAVVWVVGESLLKKKNPYYEIYMTRKQYEFDAAIKRGLIPATENAATVKSWLEKGLPELTKVSRIGDEHISVMHINNRAKRYAEKRVLRDLWKNWNSAVNHDRHETQ